MAYGDVGVLSSSGLRPAMQSIYDFEATTIDGGRQRLDVYRGRVLVIVNVASLCALTPQYAGLEALYRKYREAGLCLLGFPCDQFRHQEPGDEAEIKSFCQLNYDVSFPLFAKIDVNGPNADPLYRYLKAARPGLLGTKAIKWNFTKFLVDRRGRVVRRFAPQARAKSIERAIQPLLTQDVLPR
jgi:glutathione peroxidase